MILDFSCNFSRNLLKHPPMILQSRKKDGFEIPGQGLTRLSRNLLILPFLCAVSLAATAAGATTIVDPDPEVSSTEFGHAMVPIGDVTGDGIPDLAVGAPFQDG